MNIIEQIYETPSMSFRCENTTAYQVTPLTAVTSQEEEVKIHFPLSNDEDLTVVCVANNLVGESRKEFIHRKCFRKKKTTMFS